MTDVLARPRRVSILLVENRPDFAAATQFRLLRAGYTRVEIAPTPAAALEMAATGEYNVAIVDKRLTDDHDATDRSGVDLIPRLWETDGLLLPIMFTGFGDVPEAQSLKLGPRWERPTVYDYVEKAKELGEITQLISAIETVERGHFFHNPEDVLGSVPFDEITFPFQRRDADDAERLRYREECETLLRWVLPRGLAEKNLRVTPLAVQGRSGATVVRVEWDGSLGYLLKIGTRIAIEEEWRNYRAYVERKLGRHPRLNLDICQVARRLGVLCYDAVVQYDPDGALVDLTEFLRSQPVDAGPRAVRIIVGSVKSWYAHRRPPALLDLSSFYEAHFQVEVAGLAKRLGLLLPEGMDALGADVLPPSLTGRAVANPLDLLRRSRFMVETSLVTCHGDLNTSNVLMTGSEPWLIDFAATGPGPCVLDWVTLEAAIKLDSRWTDDADAWFRMELALARQPHLDAEVSDVDIPEALLRPFYTVLALRREVARQIRPSAGTAEYFIGLLYATLGQTRYYWRKHRNDKPRRALASAGLVAERLVKLSVEDRAVSIAYFAHAQTGSRPPTRIPRFAELRDVLDDASVVAGSAAIVDRLAPTAHPPGAEDAIEALRVARTEAVRDRVDHELGRRLIERPPSLDELRRLQDALVQLDPTNRRS